MLTRILLCVDGSQHSVRASRAAAEIARRFDAEVTLLSVFSRAIPYVPVGSDGGMAFAYTETDADPEIAARFHEDAQREAARVLSEQHVSFQTLSEVGQPVDSITQVAESVRADLIVLGSRGLGGFTRLLLGSVSDGVLHHAPCAVLIVR